MMSRREKGWPWSVPLANNKKHWAQFDGCPSTFGFCQSSLSTHQAAALPKQATIKIEPSSLVLMAHIKRFIHQKDLFDWWCRSIPMLGLYQNTVHFTICPIVISHANCLLGKVLLCESSNVCPSYVKTCTKSSAQGFGSSLPESSHTLFSTSSHVRWILQFVSTHIMLCGAFI